MHPGLHKDRRSRSAAIASAAVILALLALPGGFAMPAGASPRGPEVTVAFVPAGTDLSALDPDEWARGLLSSGMGLVPAAQTSLDIGQGARVAGSAYGFRLPDAASMPLGRFMKIAAHRAGTAPRLIEVGALRRSFDRSGVKVDLERFRLGRIAFSSPEDIRLRTAPAVGVAPAGRFRAIRARPAELARLRDGMDRQDTLIALEMPGAGRLLDVAIAGEGFRGELGSTTTHLVPLVSSVDLAPTILERLGLAVPHVIEGSPITGEGHSSHGSIREVQSRLSQIRERRGGLLVWGSVLLVLFFAVAGVAGRAGGIRFAVAQTAVALPLAVAALILVPALRPAWWVELLLAFGLASAGAWILRRRLGDFDAYAAACGLALVAAAGDLVFGLGLIPFSILGSNPIGGVRYFGIGNELEAILTVCLLLGIAAWATARPAVSPRRLAAIYLLGGLALTLVLVPGRLGADVGAVITVSAGIAAAYLLLLKRSRKLVAAMLLLPVGLVVLFGLIDTVTGASSHFARTILDAGSAGDAGEVLVNRLRTSARTVTAVSYRPFLAILVVAVAGLVLLSRRLGNPLRRPWLSVGLYAATAALVFGAVGNDSGILLVMAGAPFVLSYWALGLIPAKAEAVAAAVGKPASAADRAGRP